MERIKQTDCNKVKETVDQTLNELFDRAGPKLRQLFNIKDRTLEGSVRSNLKVGHPDELDTQVPINIRSKDVKLLLKGKYYTNKDCPCGKHAKSKYRCDFEVKDFEISRGDFGKHFISVMKPTVQKKLKKLSLLHDNYLAPGAVTLFMVDKLKKAVQELNNEDPKIKVTLSKLLNTPAIRIKLNVKDLDHYIDVDIVPTLKYPFASLSAGRVRRLKGQPRKTQEVVEENLCLVPKFDEAWKLSFSHFENNILDSFYDGNDSDDEDYDCKKDCLRYAKCRLIKWKSKSSSGLKGISSYLLKTLLFRACEKKPKKNDWSKERYVQRYLEIMKDFSQCLSKKRMQEFFNTSVNLLERKKATELEELKEFITKEIETTKRIARK